MPIDFQRGVVSMQIRVWIQLPVKLANPGSDLCKGISPHVQFSERGLLKAEESTVPLVIGYKKGVVRIQHREKYIIDVHRHVVSHNSCNHNLAICNSQDYWEDVGDVGGTSGSRC